MKPKLIFLELLVILGLGALLVQNVQVLSYAPNFPVVGLVAETRALECVPTFPVVGLVSSISVEDFFTEIVLDKFYIFTTSFNTSYWDVNNTISIDEYENIVKEYVRNNFQLSDRPPSEYKDSVGKISIPTSAYNQIQIKNGDIIINGPPFHVCSYGFTGIFTRDGKLKNAIVNDDYQDYSYRNSKLVVKPGKKLECNGLLVERCKMEVKFNLDGKAFKLTPGQSYKPTAKPIKSIFLLDSSDRKKRSDGTVVDFGMNTYVTYVLDFSDSVIQPTPLPTSTPTPTPEPEPSPEPTPPVENLNFFQKIWRWFVSLFR